MAYEPFSLSTRKTRTSLLVFSTLALAITQFDVRLKNIPGVGFEIPVPEGLLYFVVGVGVSYLTIAFVLYFIDYITYMSRPENFQAESQRLIDENAEANEKIGQLETEISEVEKQQGKNISRATSHGTSETRSMTTGSSFNVGSSESQSASVTETQSFSVRLSELELLKRKVDENNERLRGIRITKATWIRIYVFDTALPLIFGLIANAQIWLRGIEEWA